MKPGRRPKPTAIKIAKGEKKNRINFHEPKLSLEKDGCPPPMLDAIAVSEWNRLFPELKKSGVLCRTDRQTFAAYCHAYSTWRAAAQAMTDYPPLETGKGKNKRTVPFVFETPNGLIQQIPAVNICRQWGLVMVRHAAELGLTPSSRSGVMGINTDKGKEDDLLAKLMGDGSEK